MCGIVGEMRFTNKLIDKATIERMRDRLIHRGPDDTGIFIDQNIGFGFRRLAILDLSPGGHQPMQSSDGKVTIVFNGEIYNFKDLRNQLEERGYIFKSKSDTEVILALYQEYGLDFLEYLRGMFAIALWDAIKQRLVLARDRLGKKPLKYYLDSQGIIFGSEIKAILKHPRVPKYLDPAAIHHYLTLQYIPAPWTGFLGIKKLPAAHYAVIERGEMKIKRYWQIDFRKKEQRSIEEWILLIRQELEDCVKLRMISDVPLGAFLSGGIDSSAVVAMMAKNSARPVKTFSIGFREEKYNELPFAKMIAKQFGTEHTEFVIEPQATDILPKLAMQYDEPFADSSAFATYVLSKLTRKYVTVALNGDGGDENFAGYERYPIFALAQRLEKIPKFFRHVLAAGAGFLRLLHNNTFLDRADRFSKSLLQSSARQYLEYMQYFSDEYKRANYTGEFIAKLGSVEDSSVWLGRLMNTAETQDSVDRAVFTDIQTYLPDDLLVKVDMASMAWSLEGRSPLLDQRLLELTAKIPSSLKVRGNQKKVIFRKALRGIIPDLILDRPKRGFSVPIDVWFRGELNGYIKTHLLDGRFIKRNILRPDSVQLLVHKHTRGRISYAYQLWALLMLELWYEQYFD